MHRIYLVKILRFSFLYFIFLFVPLLFNGVLMRYMWLLLPFANFEFLNRVNPNLLLATIDTFPIFTAFGLVFIGLSLRKKFRLREVYVALISAFITVVLVGTIPLFVHSVSVKSGPKMNMGPVEGPRYSIMRGVEMLRCGLVSGNNATAWTYPEQGASNVPTYSPVVVHFAGNVQRVENCGVFHSNDESYVGSEHKMLGGLGNTNYSILPPGALGIEELKHLQSLSEDEVKQYVSNGHWQEGTRYNVICTYYVSNCLSSTAFSFTSDTEQSTETPTIRRDIPTIQLDKNLFTPGVYPGAIELSYPTPGMYPGNVQLDTSTNDGHFTGEFNFEENKIIETPVEIQR
ncbi:hypothetical protein KBB12_03215 [Candidatus Woesebacteria bacterium]|nr:hypothetical protein [Candidatus Woesebacteria bacterium]